MRTGPSSKKKRVRMRVRPTLPIMLPTVPRLATKEVPKEERKFLEKSSTAATKSAVRLEMPRAEPMELMPERLAPDIMVGREEMNLAVSEMTAGAMTATMAARARMTIR